MDSQEQPNQSNNAAPNASPVSRRQALVRSAATMLGLAGTASLLSGCSSSSGASNRAAAARPTDVPPAGKTTDELLRRWGSGSRRRPSDAVAGDWEPLPSGPYSPGTFNYSGLVQRSSWSRGNPVPSLMDRMVPINRVTVHHDGMTSFTTTAQSAAAARIEAIRRAHRGQNWGDIGYHFLIDPSGRVWEGRPLAWQGAHVKNNNEGNIGICVLGNYERQRVTDRQVYALDNFLASTMRQYGIAKNRVYTHRELRSTACPGRSLQARMDSLRNSRGSALASL